MERNEAPAAPSSPSGAIVSGFDQSSYGPNDDGSWDCVGQGDGVPTGCTPSLVSLPFGLNFFGTTYDSLYLNNNGNLTFGQPLGTYTPYPLSELGPPIIAPFFADVDTRTGNTVTFGSGTIDGHDAWGVNWPYVGCFSTVTSVQNAFQVLLIDRSDIAPGDFDVEFNYGNIQWEAGEASGGDGYCLGGTAARAGYASGSGETGSYFELPGSGANGALLDSNATTGLIYGSYNSSQPGRYVYRFRAGSPLTTSGAPLTAVGLGSGNSAVHNPTCSHGPPVNCASGDFWHTFTDVDIPGRGPGLNLTRTYNSLSASSEGIFGCGWSSSYDMHLTSNNDGTVTITAEDGSQATAIPTDGGTFSVPAWADSRLTQNPDGTWTFDRQQTDTFTFSAAGALTEIADRNGYETTLSYNETGELNTITDSAGRTLSFAYGSNGLVSSVTDPVGRVTQYGYDTAGDLTTVTDPANGVTSFTYSPDHLLLSMTDPDNGTTTNVYDGSGRVTQQTDAMNRVTTYGYSGDNFSATGGSTTITDPNGNVEVQEYVSGELMTLTRAAGTSDEATWTYAYDPSTLGHTSVTDPDGHTSTAGYDADGNETSATDARGRTTTATYNGFDEPLTITDPSNVTTTYTYDSNGNLSSVSRPLDSTSTQTTTFTFGDSAHPGDVTAQTDPDGHVTHLTYDSQGDLASVTDPAGDETTYTYNTDGERTSMVSPRGNVSGGDPNTYTTTYTYDELGRLTTTTDPLDHITKQGYDGDGDATSVTDGDGNQTTYEYDADNELTKITHADGTTLTYGYDGDGNQTRQTNGAGKATSYTYDGLDRLTSATDPLNRKTSYSYDKAGNRTSLTDPSGRTTTFGYDAANELTSISYSDGTTPNVSFTYTPSGLRATMSDGTGTTSYSYDHLNRLTSQTNGDNQTVSYGYDLAGNLTSLTYPNNQTVTRTYDDANRLTGITDWLGHTTRFTPDPDSNVSNIAYPNGVTSTSAFDAANQLSSITDQDSGGSTIAGFGYGRDNNGQLTGETPSGTGQGSSQSYGYDQLNRLTTVNSNAYSYDAADNLTGLIDGTSQSYDPANQLTSSTVTGDATSYTYNPEGDRTRASSNPLLSLSGNEITDAVRSSKPVTQGDGRAAPDSSFGVWAATTNLETNGGFESGISGWIGRSNATTSWDQLQWDAKFGSGSLKIVTPGTNDNEGTEATGTAVGASTTYSSSLWVKAASGATLTFCVEEIPSNTCHNLNFTGNGRWQRYTQTFTTASATTGLTLEVSTNGLQATTFWLDGAQIEEQAIATPYVDTNGTSASRGSPFVKLPVANAPFTETQGWAAFRVRMGWAYNNAPNNYPALMSWISSDSSGTHSIQLYFSKVGTKFVLVRRDDPDSGIVSPSSISQFAAGDHVTVVVAWTATELKISVNGSAFHTVSNTTIPMINATMIKLGTSNQYGANPLNGDISWAAAGSGTLSDTDAATLNTFGDTDPILSQLPGSPGLVWAANTATYQTTSSSSGNYGYDQANRLDWSGGVASIASADGWNSYFVGADGNLWASGYALGTDEPGGSASTPVQETMVSGVTAVAGTPGATYVLKPDGTAWAWGSGYAGELGDGSTQDSAAPVRIGNLTDVTALAGGSNGMALTSEGTVWTWGEGGQGQLGNGTLDNSSTPVQVSNLAGVTAIAAGAYYDVALKSDGTVWSWGQGGFGQLGDGGTNNSSTPVQATGLSDVIAIASLGNDTLALKSDGTVWAWGYNYDGELGNGTTTDSSTPVQVSNLTNVVAIASGEEHSLALKSDGTVWAWGYNGDGELGNGTTTNALTPVQVSGLNHVTAIAGGQSWSLAMKNDDTVWGWGYNGDGELGNGTTTDSTTPVQTIGLPAKTTYTYDGDGLRASTSGGSTQHFAWDISGSMPLLLTDGSTSYIYDDEGLPVEQIDNNGTPLYYQHDQLGSTRLLTNQDGDTAATYTYDPYGNLTSYTGSADTPLRWAGEYQDATTGLYYLRARYYDPQTGQFISVDPLVDLTETPFAYVNGDPVNSSDPTGAATCGSHCGGEVSKEAIRQALQSSGSCSGQGSTTVLLAEALLPTGGSFPYNSGQKGGRPIKLPRGQGYRDKSGNVWQWDPQKGEWDVQHPDGSHTNVGPNGEITHGPNNFPAQPRAPRSGGSAQGGGSSSTTSTLVIVGGGAVVVGAILLAPETGGTSLLALAGI